MDDVRDLFELDDDLRINAVKESSASLFYEKLRELVLRGSGTSLSTTGSQRSDLSHSTDEDKGELVAEIVLKDLLAIPVGKLVFTSRDGQSRLRCTLKFVVRC